MCAVFVQYEYPVCYELETGDDFGYFHFKCHFTPLLVRTVYTSISLHASRVDALGRRCSVRRPDVVAQTRDGGTPSLAGDALNILYTAPRGDWSEREGRSETTDCLSDSTLYSLDTCDMRHLITFDLTFDSLQGGGAAAGGIGVFFNTRKGQFQYKKGSISIHDNTAAGRK